MSVFVTLEAIASMGNNLCLKGLHVTCCVFQETYCWLKTYWGCPLSVFFLYRKLEKQKEKKRKEEQKRKIASLSFNPEDGEDDEEENEEEEQDCEYWCQGNQSTHWTGLGISFSCFTVVVFYLLCVCVCVLVQQYSIRLLCLHPSPMVKNVYFSKDS